MFLGEGSLTARRCVGCEVCVAHPTLCLVKRGETCWSRRPYRDWYEDPTYRDIASAMQTWTIMVILVM